MQTRLRWNTGGYCPGIHRYRGCGRRDPEADALVLTDLGVVDVDDIELDTVFRRLVDDVHGFQFGQDDHPRGPGVSLSMAIPGP